MSITRAGRTVTSGPMSVRRLVEGMRELGITEDDLAHLSGVSERTVRRWLKGQADIPLHIERDIETWVRCPEALKVAAEWYHRTSSDLEEDIGPDDPLPGLH